MPLKKGCGRPFTLSLDRTKRFFYAEDIYTREVSIISDFRLHRDIFFAFFGREHPSKIDTAPSDGNTPAYMTGIPEHADNRQNHPQLTVVNRNADANVETNVSGEAGHNAEYLELDRRMDSVHTVDPSHGMDWESTIGPQISREPINATTQPIQSGEIAQANTGEDAVEGVILSNRMDIMDPSGRLAREVDQMLNNAFKGNLIFVDLVASGAALLRSDFNLTREFIAQHLSLYFILSRYL